MRVAYEGSLQRGRALNTASANCDFYHFKGDLVKALFVFIVVVATEI